MHNNDETTCSNCGAIEFNQVCDNCGTVYQDGVYCPRCGVKAGQKPYQCPNCGKLYFSNACPNCGYTYIEPQQENVAANYNISNPQTNSHTQRQTPNSRKKKTAIKNTMPKKRNGNCLSILIWVLFFPIMLTVVIIRSNKLSKLVKGILVSLIWIISIVIISSDSSSTSVISEKGIRSFSFARNSAVELMQGHKTDETYVNVRLKSGSKIYSEDIQFVSENPEIATISYTKTDATGTYFYYIINAVSPGSTHIYVRSSDGVIVSKIIPVTVLEPGGSIQYLTFNYPRDVTIKEGQSTYTSNISASKKSKYDKINLREEDVVFVSEDPNIAIISCTGKSFSLSDDLSYQITGVHEGTTNVYASSADGRIVSDKIKVTVLPTIKPERIVIENSVNEIVLGETISLKAQIFPDNAEDKTITWSSNNESVAIINDCSLIGVGEGKALITATTSNGITDSFNVVVDGTRRMMNVHVNRTNDNNNNIGYEWNYIDEINGERVFFSEKRIIAVGDTLAFTSRYIEEDDNPDVGEGAASHYVTKDDVINGFTVPLEFYVVENGGAHKGYAVHFFVNYVFTP